MPDLIVGHVGNHFFQFGVLTKEILTDVITAHGLEVLVLTIDALFHHPAQKSLLVALKQRIPTRTPKHFNNVPTGAKEGGFKLLDYLSITAHRPVETLQVTVDNKHEIIELLTHGHSQCAHRFRLVHLTVTEKCPNLAVFGFRYTTTVEITHEARLIDGHHRTEPHRHGWELPKIGHQPWMRIRRQTFATDFLPEMVQIVLG